MDEASNDGGPIRVALFQPVLAHYRVALFNAFDAALGGGLTVFTVPASASTRLGGGDACLTARWRDARTWRLGPVWFVPSALGAVLSRRWDVVVLSWNSRQVELLPALLLGRLCRVPVVLWGHGLGGRRSGAGLVLRRLQARLSTAVVTYGEAGADEVRDLVPGHRVTVLLNTTGRPPPAGSAVLTAPRRRVAHLGRVLAPKHVDHLIEAVARLDAEGIHLDVDIVGDGPDRPAVDAAVERHGLEDRVRWHGHVTEWERVRALLDDVDLVVLPARAGLAVVDAFAAARGAVVVDGAGMNPPEADLVVDGVNGFRYSPLTVDALADRLREAYQAPGALQRVSAAAGNHYREELGLDHAARTFVDIVDRARATR